MYKRKLLLLAISLVVLVLLFLLPVNRQWSNTLFSYWNGFQKQKDDLSFENRLRLRFGTHYTLTKAIGDSVKKKAGESALVLLPPTSYFKKMGVAYRVPVSPVFYYYTGVKTVWANNPHAAAADWYVRVSKGHIIVERATDKKALQDTILAFQKLGVHL